MMLRSSLRPWSTFRCMYPVVERRGLAAVANPKETGFKIPIVDFGAFQEGDEPEKRRIAYEVLEGFTSSGFIYLANTGLPKGAIQNAFNWSKKFFDLPMEEKIKYAWETPESNRGYVAPGREKVSRLLDAAEIEKIRQKAPDLKESLEIGKEPSDNFQVRLRCPRINKQNQWPEKLLPRFHEEMMKFYEVPLVLSLTV
jgi:isopenicillin N synthase-like dioxygenase